MSDIALFAGGLLPVVLTCNHKFRLLACYVEARSRESLFSCPMYSGRYRSAAPDGYHVYHFRLDITCIDHHYDHNACCRPTCPSIRSGVQGTSSLAEQWMGRNAPCRAVAGSNILSHMDDGSISRFWKSMNILRHISGDSDLVYLAIIGDYHMDVLMRDNHAHGMQFDKYRVPAFAIDLSQLAAQGFRLNAHTLELLPTMTPLRRNTQSDTRYTNSPVTTASSLLKLEEHWSRVYSRGTLYTIISLRPGPAG
ncbi:hypothetical protein DFJ58DRAFT_840264 [Suillus subalutaceus]|uniref:uncharacterized protein n=1 Tax=Suillus subalutaceus TaxID=48586 RepID=UPI001B86391A|nr:uncharacterized protein DFJ58DRAFT_840264 [Suillus subalutaceus]KAG1858976.1 hypothetical protein DFJ58DRAFT_840264 [Suillus subalutaceus]